MIWLHAINLAVNYFKGIGIVLYHSTLMIFCLIIIKHTLRVIWFLKFRGIWITFHIYIWFVDWWLRCGAWHWCFFLFCHLINLVICQRLFFKLEDIFMKFLFQLLLSSLSILLILMPHPLFSVLQPKEA